MLRLHTITVPANGFAPMPFDADYIRVQNASIEFWFKTQEGDDFKLLEGEEAFLQPFQVMTIENRTGSPQDITFYIGKNGAKVGSAKVSGNVTIDNTAGAFTQGRASVTTVNQALIAANAARRYLLIQNNDASAVLRVTLDGAAATAGEGFRIEAGESLELSDYVPTGAINCMMETASVAVDNVEFCEG